jgi:mRNA interferase YafQ
MRTPTFLNRFRKDLQRQKKRGKKPEKITNIIDYICKNGDAPPRCRPHNLVGNWSGYRECHIEPDWLLIFQVFDETVTFFATGTHSDLFR